MVHSPADIKSVALLRRWSVFTACAAALAATAAGQQASGAASVVLSQIHVFYPPIAESARVQGKVDVRVSVRPDGTVAELAAGEAENRSVEGLLRSAAVAAASGARFECRGCTQPATPHTITFVFTLDYPADKPPPPVWREAGDARSEVTVFGTVQVCDHCGAAPQPTRKRSGMCLWLWRCGL